MLGTFSLHSSSFVSRERVKTFSLLPPAARRLHTVLGFQEGRCKISHRRFRCKLTGSFLQDRESVFIRTEEPLKCAAQSAHTEVFFIWTEEHVDFLYLYNYLGKPSRPSSPFGKTLMKLFFSLTNR